LYFDYNARNRSVQQQKKKLQVAIEVIAARGESKQQTCNRSYLLLIM